MTRCVPLLSVALLLGCNAALKERNVDLEVRLDETEAALRSAEDRVHELEHELDVCQAEVDRKAVREELARVHVDPDQPLFADVVTSMGTFRIELRPSLAPRAVANFVGLAEGSVEWTDPRTGELRSGEPLYRDLLFHRVVPGLTIQTGDPLGNGTGGPGYSFPDEFSEQLLHDRAGVVSMANAGPDTNGSQWFVTLRPMRHLDGKHSAFGVVVEGMDVVEAIGAVPVGRRGRERPDQDVWLREVRIIRPGDPG